MILYFLKVAWRNLLKYKAQSVISILGLAICKCVWSDSSDCGCRHLFKVI